MRFHVALGGTGAGASGNACGRAAAGNKTSAIGNHKMLFITCDVRQAAHAA
jgi:hypothetical protein